MPEVEQEHSCNNCGSKYTLMYDTESVSYEPETCPFCAEAIDFDASDDYFEKSFQESEENDEWEWEEGDKDN